MSTLCASTQELPTPVARVSSYMKALLEIWSRDHNFVEFTRSAGCTMVCLTEQDFVITTESLACLPCPLGHLPPQKLQ